MKQLDTYLVVINLSGSFAFVGKTGEYKKKLDWECYFLDLKEASMHAQETLSMYTDGWSPSMHVVDIEGNTHIYFPEINSTRQGEYK